MVRATAGVTGLCFLLAACGSAPTRFYTLEPVAPKQTVSGAAAKPPIEVGAVPVPAELDRDAVVLRDGGDRLDISGQDQWGAPLGSLVRQALTADLTARLASGSVLAPGSTAPKAGLRVLKVELQHFMGDTNGAVRLDANWSLLRAGSSDVLRRGHEVVHVQAASGKPADVVPAMSEALGQFADRITRAIG
jgi:uncharacterized lipoprotein YmbA